jgi:hypothetical protein
MSGILEIKNLHRHSAHSEELDQHSTRDNSAQPSTNQQFRKEVYDEIIRRLHDQGLSTGQLNELDLAWCLPKEGDNPVTWTTLLQHPAFLNDDDLSSILHLRQSTRDTPAPGQNTTIYYIRSYAYTVAELTHVIQNLFEEGALRRKGLHMARSHGRHGLRIAHLPQILWYLFKKLCLAAESV